MKIDIKELEGKTIKKIEEPDELELHHNMNCDIGTEYDDNIVITFTDGTILKLASWDYEGYSSGIYKEIIK